MKVTAELTYLPNSSLDEIGHGALIEFAETAEAVGFDAIGFNEHPAPSKKWLDHGGHDAFDPLAALAFCAAVTRRVRLLPYLTILPLHNPFLFAKTIATLDVISDGRVIVGAAAGYLRSEFAAADVPFEERNVRLDEALDVVRSLWVSDSFSGKAQSYDAVGQVSTPPPVQRPHPPIWIGGNSAKSRARVARLGAGWAPLMIGDVAASTTRTVPLPDIEAVGAAIADLYRRLEEVGRDPRSVEIQIQSPESVVAGSGEFDAEQHLDYLAQLEAIGVTQFVVHLKAGQGLDVPGVLHRYASDVMSRLG